MGTLFGVSVPDGSQNVELVNLPNFSIDGEYYSLSGQDYRSVPIICYSKIVSSNKLPPKLITPGQASFRKSTGGLRIIFPRVDPFTHFRKTCYLLTTALTGNPSLRSAFEI